MKSNLPNVCGGCNSTRRGNDIAKNLGVPLRDMRKMQKFSGCHAISPPFPVYLLYVHVCIASLLDPIGDDQCLRLQIRLMFPSSKRHHVVPCGP